MPSQTVQTSSALGFNVAAAHSKSWMSFGVWARPWVFALVVGLLHAVILWPARHHDFVLDDAVYITENTAVTKGVHLQRYFADRSTVASDVELQWQSYRPLRTIVFRTVAAAVGAHAWAFRTASLACWIVCLLFLFRWLQRLGVRPRTALVVGALFALAPVHVEALVYPSALGDMLSLALQLAAIDLLVATWMAPPSRSVWLARTTLAWCLSISALLVKESAVVTPFLLCAFALEVWRWPQISKLRVSVDIGVQLFAVAIVLAVRTAVLSAVGHAPTTVHSVTSALLRLPWLVLNYLRICIVPLGHVPSYIVPTPNTGMLVLVWLLGLTLAGAVLWKGKGWLRFGVLWFAVGLGPVLGLVPLAADMADRYALLSSFGLAFAAVALVQTILQTHLARWAWVLGLVLGLLYVAGSAIEQAAWASDLTLWTKAVAVEPTAPQAYRNLGLIRVKQGRGEEAAKLLRRSVALGSSWRVHYYLAMALESNGKIHEAHAEAVREVQGNPKFGRAHALRGGLAMMVGNTNEARAALREAQKLEPTHPSTLMLGLELANLDSNHAAEDTLSQQLMVQAPSDPRFMYYRARALLVTKPNEAQRLCEQCLQVSPENVFCSALLGRVLLQLGRPSDARARLESAAQKLAPHTRESVAVRDALRKL